MERDISSMRRHAKIPPSVTAPVQIRSRYYASIWFAKGHGKDNIFETYRNEMLDFWGMFNISKKLSEDIVDIYKSTEQQLLLRRHDITRDQREQLWSLNNARIAQEIINEKTTELMKQLEEEQNRSNQCLKMMDINKNELKKKDTQIQDLVHRLKSSSDKTNQELQKKDTQIRDLVQKLKSSEEKSHQELGKHMNTKMAEIASLKNRIAELEGQRFAPYAPYASGALGLAAGAGATALAYKLGSGGKSKQKRKSRRAPSRSGPIPRDRFGRFLPKSRR